MNPGPRVFGGATVEIVSPMGIPARLRGSVREVHNLRSETPGEGHGTELMRIVCGEADRESCVLMLMVSQDDNKPLVEWYGRFGFKPTSDSMVSPVVMIRPPEHVAVIQRKPLIAALVERI